MNFDIVNILERIGKINNNMDELISFHKEKSKKVLSEVLSQALHHEAMTYLGIKAKHELTPNRRGYLHTKYTRSLETPIGLINISRTRVNLFNKAERYSSSLLPLYSRRTNELSIQILTLYFLGLSCRKTLSQLQQTLGISISPSGISRILQTIDKKSKAFHKRKISKRYRIIWVDGMQSTIRNNGKGVLLLIFGEDYTGKKEIIDFRVSLHEDEKSYEDLLSDLYKRGMSSPEVFVHDGHIGLNLPYVRYTHM